ncbi:MAG TPA: phosphoenolpyruvate-utilizing N-terminal domain-containing protein [Candidatus Omnitrophota bacterium]|nr:phosphoenolpyruvate-utilizing N-terminal domain-containing protein [Candidatus Omnitrophota bacterium]
MTEKKKNPAKKQRKIKGIPAAPGIVVGKAYVFGTETVSPKERVITDREIDGEIKKFETALEKTRKELLDIEKKISKEMGVEHGRIFSAHLMVLEDKVLIGEVVSQLKKRKRNISFVFAEVLNRYTSALSGAKDEYLRDRSSDIADVGKRVLKNLIGTKERSMESLDEKSIIIAYDLSPSDTAMMHKGRVLGFATDIGGRTSHTAIMAKSLEIPAVVGLESVTDLVSNGDQVILDGIHGVVIVSGSEKKGC